MSDGGREAPGPRKAVNVRVSGRVQGVGYRDWTRREAEGLGLDGWVRNRADGTVEALFAGPGDIVDRMVKRCRTGPRAAQVEEVELVEAEDPGAGFSVRGTE